MSVLNVHNTSNIHYAFLIVHLHPCCHSKEKSETSLYTTSQTQLVSTLYMPRNYTYHVLEPAPTIVPRIPAVPI